MGYFGAVDQRYGDMIAFYEDNIAAVLQMSPEEFSEFHENNKAMIEDIERVCGLVIANNLNFQAIGANLSMLRGMIAGGDILVNYLGLYFDTQTWNPKQMVEHGHTPETYIVWVNSIFYGCNGWLGSDIASIDLDCCGYGPCKGIGKGCFSGCTNLERVGLTSHVVNVGTSAFSGCTSLSEIDLPSLRTVGEKGFYNCADMRGLGSAVLDSVGANGFSGCTSLERIELCCSAACVGYSAFFGCSGLKDVTIPVELEPTYVFNISDQIEEIHYYKGSTGVMGDWQKEYSTRDRYFTQTLGHMTRTTLKWVEFGEGITHIGACAFCRFDDNERTLERVDLPTTLISVGDYAFADQPGVGILAIPDGIESFGVACFSGFCITELLLPDSVSYVGESAFSGCACIEELTLPGDIGYVGSGAFSGCSGLKEITLPVDLVAGNIFSGVNQLETIHYLKGKTGVMYDRETFHDNYDKYYRKTLEYQSQETLRDIDFEEGITRIGSCVFRRQDEGDRLLTHIELPSTLESIGDYAFYGQSGLRNLLLPQGLRVLSNGCFGGCTSVSLIEFWGDVPQIDPSAFASVSSKVGYPTENETWTQDVFKNYGGDLTWVPSPQTTLTLPKGLLEINESAFEGCDVHKVVLPDGLERIGERAFSNCANTIVIWIPDSVISIAPNAFEGTSTIICAAKNSEAWNYARREGIALRIVSDWPM